MSRTESEFTGESRKSGIQSAVKANDKAQVMRRMEKNPDTETFSLDDPADKFRLGGIPEYTDPAKWWVIT